MFLRCTQCGNQVDAEVGRCESCGLVLGTFRAEQSEQAIEFDIDFESEITVDDEVWAGAEGEGQGEGSPDKQDKAQIISNLERALKLTNVSDAKGLLQAGTAYVVPSFDPAAVRLTPFEVHLLRLIDGELSVGELVAESKLTLYEAVIALTSLHDKGGISFEQPSEFSEMITEPESRDLPEAESGEAADGSALGRVALRRKVVGAKGPRLAEPDPDVLLDRADSALQEGNLELAREYSRLAFMQAPNSDRAQKLKKELHDERHAVTRAKLLMGHGIRAYTAGDFYGAIRLFNGALEEHEALPVAHHRIALATVRINGELEDAERHCARACELAPSNEIYQRNLLRIQKRRESEDKGSS